VSHSVIDAQSADFDQQDFRAPTATSSGPVSPEQAMLQLNPVIEMTFLDRERIGRELPVHFSPSHARYRELHRDLGFEATKKIVDVRRLLETFEAGLTPNS
jgi:hypothetical protein